MGFQQRWSTASRGRQLTSYRVQRETRFTVELDNQAQDLAVTMDDRESTHTWCQILVRFITTPGPTLRCSGLVDVVIGRGNSHDPNESQKVWRVIHLAPTQVQNLLVSQGVGWVVDTRQAGGGHCSGEGGSMLNDRSLADSGFGCECVGVPCPALGAVGEAGRVRESNGYLSGFLIVGELRDLDGRIRLGKGRRRLEAILPTSNEPWEVCLSPSPPSRSTRRPPSSTATVMPGTDATPAIVTKVNKREDPLAHVTPTFCEPFAGSQGDCLEPNINNWYLVRRITI